MARPPQRRPSPRSAAAALSLAVLCASCQAPDGNEDEAPHIRSMEPGIAAPGSDWPSFHPDGDDDTSEPSNSGGDRDDDSPGPPKTPDSPSTGGSAEVPDVTMKPSQEPTDKPSDPMGELPHGSLDAGAAFPSLDAGSPPEPESDAGADAGVDEPEG